MQYTEEALVQAVAALGWDVVHDDIHVEIGGTSVYEIEGLGTKWAPVKGTRKYNKDAFIVIKNMNRESYGSSQANPDLKHIMPDPDALWKDIQKLDDLYEELLWHPDDELQFTHDGQRIIITNKTQEQKQ